MSVKSSDTLEPAWTWSGDQEGMGVAFFGRHTAESASELRHRLAPIPEAMSWLRQIHSARVCRARPGLAGEADAVSHSLRIDWFFEGHPSGWPWGSDPVFSWCV